MPEQTSTTPHASAFATLIVAAILSHRPCVGESKRCNNGADKEGGSASDEGGVVETVLRGVVATLSITFAVTSTLPSSQLAFVHESSCAESEEDKFHDCLNSIPNFDDIASCSTCTNVQNARKEQENVGHTDRVYPIVDCNNVQTAWTRRTRLSRTCRANVFLPQSQEASSKTHRDAKDEASTVISRELISIPEFSEVPEMTRCDSVVSALSVDTSFSPRPCSDSFNLTPSRETKNVLSSLKQNEEWLSRASRVKSLLRQFQETSSNPQRVVKEEALMKTPRGLISVPEFSEVPEMMRCDSLVSTLSSDISFNSVSSLGSLNLSPVRALKRTWTSSRQNAEWAIFE